MPSIPQVTIKRSEAGAVTRQLDVKIAEASVSVTDWGATGLNDVNDKARVQAESNQLPYGSTLEWPPRQYLLTEGGLAQNREHHWVLDPNALIRGDYRTGQTTDLVSIRISDTDGNSESRNGKISGGRWLIRNLDYDPETDPIEDSFAAGGFAITVDGSGGYKPVLGLRITGADISGGVGAVSFTGSDEDHTVAWSQLSECTLTNGVACFSTADGLSFHNNVTNGIKPAYTFDILPGSFNYTIQGGTTSNRNGALDIYNASMWRMLNVQVEHGLAYSASGQTLGSQVIVRGTTYPSFLGIIEKCNFGAGIGKVENTIVLQNAQGTVIDENYFNLSDAYDLRIESLARHTVIGTRNMHRGSRTRQPVGEVTDAARLLRIVLPADGSGNRAIGTRGVWHPAS